MRTVATVRFLPVLCFGVWQIAHAEPLPAPPPVVSPTPSQALPQPSEGDWRLPDWVQPVPNSGVYGVDNVPPGFQDVEGVVLPRRLLEPEEGGYDWSLLTKALARQQPVWLRFFAFFAQRQMQIPIRNLWKNFSP